MCRKGARNVSKMAVFRSGGGLEPISGRAFVRRCVLGTQASGTLIKGT